MLKRAMMLVLATALFWPLSAASVTVQAQTWYSMVTAIDGDTLRVNRVGTVRVLYLDTPEKGRLARCPREADLARVATERAQQLVAGGVQLVREGRPIDRYGRPLRIVILRDGRRLDHVLIAEGLGVEYRGRGPRMNWCAQTR